MKTQPHAGIARLTLRHWTTDSRFVGGAERPSRALPYSEAVDDKFQRLASMLARIKSDRARPVL